MRFTRSIKISEKYKFITLNYTTLHYTKPWKNNETRNDVLFSEQVGFSLDIGTVWGPILGRVQLLGIFQSYSLLYTHRSSQNQNCINVQCTRYLWNDVWNFSSSAYSNSEKSPWKHNLSISILNPEAVIRAYRFLYKLSVTWSWLWQENKQFMKNCDDFLSLPG